MELFSVEGIPDEIMRDNGPPFNGKELVPYRSWYQDTPHHHQTTHRLMASLRERSRP